jgi:hypothetical protein
VKLDESDRDRLLQDVGTEIEELTTLVANLADLARGSQRDLHLRQLRLDEVAEVVVSRAHTRFPELDFTLKAEPTTVWGDSEDVERAIWNLVETPRSGTTAAVVWRSPLLPAKSPFATTGPASPPPTGRSSSTASAARTAHAASRRQSGWGACQCQRPCRNSRAQ